MSKSEAVYDLVLFGVTGFTGKLVAQYLLRQDTTDKPLNWAMAGRNVRKLERVKAALVAEFPHAKDVPIIEADSGHQESLDAMVQQTRVVCTTVGPYARYGSGLVEACVKSGTHYCDLTGETHWIKQMVDEYHDLAQAHGARIVHCCGFDSIPSDLGTWLLQQTSQSSFDGPCEEVNFYITKLKGGFSGGTVASIVNLVKEARADKNIRRILLDAYALNPSDQRPSIKQRDQMGVAFASDIEQWTGPFMMAAINTRIVRRSNALLGNAYGEQFRYAESSAFGGGVKGRLKAAGFTAAYAALMGGLSTDPTRRLLVGTVLPDPGNGPSTSLIENGFFEAQLLGHKKRGQGSDICVTVSANKDPGYGATAIMLAESAKCLALDALDSEGGILTPSVAMGQALLDRLVQAGMRFDVKIL